MTSQWSAHIVTTGDDGNQSRLATTEHGGPMGSGWETIGRNLETWNIDLFFNRVFIFYQRDCFHLKKEFPFRTFILYGDYLCSQTKLKLFS